MLSPLTATAAGPEFYFRHKIPVPDGLHANGFNPYTVFIRVKYKKKLFIFARDLLNKSMNAGKILSS